MGNIKKFKLKLSTVILMILLSLICSLVFIICTFYIKSSSIQTNSNIQQEQTSETNTILFLEVIKEVSLIIASICGTNLLLNALVDVNYKNKLVSEIMTNDVLADENFYNSMSQDNKNALFKALEKNLYFKYPIVHDMFISLREKLKDNVDFYYFESCSYVVSCEIFDKYIEKTISKVVSIKSYEDEYLLTDFSVSNLATKTVNGISSFNLISLVIDDNIADLDNDITQKENKLTNLDEQNDYTLSMSLVYNKPIKIRKDKETKISVKCITRCPIDDTESSFRVTKPCKNFSLIYNLKNCNAYRLAVDAFGFLDDADDSANNSSSSNINITFKDWIFEYDGVVVGILKNN